MEAEFMLKIGRISQCFAGQESELETGSPLFAATDPQREPFRLTMELSNVVGAATREEGACCKQFHFSSKCGHLWQLGWHAKFRASASGNQSGVAFPQR